MHNLPAGIVVTPRVDSLVLPLSESADYSHLFENSDDWARVSDLTREISNSESVSLYLGGGTVNNWLFRGERGRDTDLLAVVDILRFPTRQRFLPSGIFQLLSLAHEKREQDRTTMIGNYGYILGNQPVKKYMNIDSGVERLILTPIPTLEENRQRITPRTIDLSLTSRANFERCYKNLNTTGAK